MLYRRKTYTIEPSMYETFTHLFHTYLLPNQLTHGAQLVGRWVNEEQTEIMAMWSYDNRVHYETVDAGIRASEMHVEAQNYRKSLTPLFISSNEDFFTSTGDYGQSKQIVAVSGCIVNEKGHVLLVRNNHRNDTYEMPGGRVEPGEMLKEAVKRVVREETGIHSEIGDMVGVYQNITSGIICMVFCGRAIAGKSVAQPPKTIDVQFVDFNKEQVGDWIKRPQFMSRVNNARISDSIAYESYEMRPYRLVEHS
ncbi:MAG TPA: NUDIX domain-containing protein [Sporosarcina psychrophila]|uniref:NUDIX domain-containing protein n=1 Tax=Sporosarcina psychrophila TaxID=1476 RepID=A0A921FYI4_SPOPS|nr:NUDIX domain-containing protein [Sporosarcina psychrophila]